MELNIEYLPVEALRPYDRNARKHAKKDIDAIAASIREFGFDDPIGIWGDGLIVEGHLGQRSLHVSRQAINAT